MPTVEFPDGNKAEMRDPDDLRRGDVRAALKAADAEGVNLMSNQFGLDAIAAIQDALILRFLESWTLSRTDGTPLPINVTTIQDLPVSAYAQMAEIVAPVLQTVLTGGMGNFQGEADPKS